MGHQNVFEFGFTKFIGVGISFSFNVENGKKVLNICISFPFCFLAILFNKHKDNKWI